MTRRTVRLASVAALAALAFPLAACQVHQGTAAFVGDVRITESQLDAQVDAFFADKYWGKQVKKGARNEVRRRTMRAMVLREVILRAERNESVDVTQSAVRNIATQYEKTPLQIPQDFQGAPTPMLADIFAGVAAIQTKLGASITDPQQLNAKFIETLKKALKDAPVELNPRYGKFSEDTFALAAGTDVGVRDLPASEAPVPAGADGSGQQQPQDQQPQDQQPQDQQPQDQQQPQN